MKEALQEAFRQNVYGSSSLLDDRSSLLNLLVLHMSDMMAKEKAEEALPSLVRTLFGNIEQQLVKEKQSVEQSEEYKQLNESEAFVSVSLSLITSIVLIPFATGDGPGSGSLQDVQEPGRVAWIPAGCSWSRSDCTIAAGEKKGAPFQRQNVCQVSNHLTNGLYLVLCTHS